jgi:TolA-binding protein
MNALAKVLVVLVLVLSVGFAAAEIVLYGKRESYGKKYLAEQKARAEVEQRLKQAQGQLADMTRAHDELKEASESEKLALKTALADEKTRTTDLTNQVNNLNTSVQSLTDGNKTIVLAVANRDQTILELRNIVANRDDAIKQNLADIDQLHKTVTERDGTIADLTNQLTDTKKAYAKLAESEERLQAIVAEWVKRGIEVPAPALPVISGRIVGVDVEHGFAVIDKGAKAGVKPAAQFTVYNDGGYVAKLVINDVQPDVSAGQIRLVNDDKEVAQGDVATTAIP